MRVFVPNLHSNILNTHTKSTKDESTNQASFVSKHGVTLAARPADFRVLRVAKSLSSTRINAFVNQHTNEESKEWEETKKVCLGARSQSEGTAGGRSKCNVQQMSLSGGSTHRSWLDQSAALGREHLPTGTKGESRDVALICACV